MVGRIRAIAWIVSLSFLFALLFLAVWTGRARAGVEPSPFSVPLLAGLEPSRYWVHFDPQPEPPGRALILDLSVPTAPIFKASGSSSGDYRLEFAIEDPPQRISSFRFVPSSDGFEVLVSNSTGPWITASFSFVQRGTAMALGSDIEFDPQPEPPGYPGVLVDFSLTGGPPGRSLLAEGEVEMTFRISDPEGHLLSLTQFLAPFVRGDANADGTADISDAVAILGFLFLGSTLNDCSDAADVNDDGVVDISDPTRLLGHLFLGSDRPPDPFLACGDDPTRDALDCRRFRGCP